MKIIDSHFQFIIFTLFIFCAGFAVKKGINLIFLSNRSLLSIEQTIKSSKKQNSFTKSLNSSSANKNSSTISSINKHTQNGDSLVTRKKTDSILKNLEHTPNTRKENLNYKNQMDSNKNSQTTGDSITAETQNKQISNLLPQPQVSSGLPESIKIKENPPDVETSKNEKKIEIFKQEIENSPKSSNKLSDNIPKVEKRSLTQNLALENTTTTLPSLLFTGMNQPLPRAKNLATIKMENIINKYLDASKPTKYEIPNEFLNFRIIEVDNRQIASILASVKNKKLSIEDATSKSVLAIKKSPLSNLILLAWLLCLTPMSEADMGLFLDFTKSMSNQYLQFIDIVVSITKYKVLSIIKQFDDDSRLFLLFYLKLCSSEFKEHLYTNLLVKTLKKYCQTTNPFSFFVIHECIKIFHNTPAQKSYSLTLPILYKKTETLIGNFVEQLNKSINQSENDKLEINKIVRSLDVWKWKNNKIPANKIERLDVNIDAGESHRRLFQQKNDIKQENFEKIQSDQIKQDEEPKKLFFNWDKPNQHSSTKINEIETDNQVALKQDIQNNSFQEIMSKPDKSLLSNTNPVINCSDKKKDGKKINHKNIIEKNPPLLDISNYTLQNSPTKLELSERALHQTPKFERSKPQHLFQETKQPESVSVSNQEAIMIIQNFEPQNDRNHQDSCHRYNNFFDNTQIQNTDKILPVQQSFENQNKDNTYLAQDCGISSPNLIQHLSLAEPGNVASTHPNQQTMPLNVYSNDTNNGLKLSSTSNFTEVHNCFSAVSHVQTGNQNKNLGEVANFQVQFGTNSAVQSHSQINFSQINNEALSLNTQANLNGQNIAQATNILNISQDSTVRKLFQNLQHKSDVERISLENVFISPSKFNQEKLLFEETKRLYRSSILNSNMQIELEKPYSSFGSEKSCTQQYIQTNMSNTQFQPQQNTKGTFLKKLINS